MTVTDVAPVDEFDPAGVYEPLTEEEMALYAILSDPSGIDQAEFLWSDDNPHPDGTVDGCFLAHPFQWPWWSNNDERQIDQCVAEGQLVLTARGHVPIEDVLVGDQVLTHNGRWRRVNAVLDQGVREVVRVKGQGHPGLLVTPDHRIYARRSRRASQPKDGHKGKKLLEPTWLAPQDWEWSDNSGTMTANWGTPAVIEALELPDEMVPAYRSGPQNYVRECWTPEWMWLYGCFLAEGSTYRDPPKPRSRVMRSVWSVHRDEVGTVTSYLDKVGLNYSLEPDGNATNIRVTSAPVTNWLRMHAGSLAHNKRVAPWVFGLPERLRRAVFEGAMFGDGSQHTDTRRSYATVSRELAVGMRLLGLSLGESVTVSAHKARTSKIGERLAVGRPGYAVEFQPVAGQRKAYLQIEDGAAWTAVRTITTAGDARVFDLEVEEDHSFVVEGIAVHNCARDIGKSTRIHARCTAFPFLYPGQEQAITAPEGTHLDKLTEAFESRVYASWFMTQMIMGGRGAIRHRPFRVMWGTSARLYCMLPQRSGLGVKGSHAVWLDCDEGQDITEKTWHELPETVRDEVPGHSWLVHGVSKGVIDEFHRMTLADSGWTVHRITSMHSPTWSEAARQQKIKDYGGSRENADYLRNVLGEHGPAMNRIFVLNRLFAARDSIETSKYNAEEYYRVTVTDDGIAARVGNKEAVATASDAAVAALHDMLDFPRNHERYDVTWMGMDIGLVSDPSELLVFGEYEPSTAERRENIRNQIAVPEPGDTRFKLLTRLKLLRLVEHLQIELIMWLINFYRPRAFAMDKTGAGAPIFQGLQHRAGTSRLMVIEPDEDAPEAERRAFDEQRSQARNALTVIKGYNFSEKVLIDFDEAKVAELGGNPDLKEMIDKAGIKQHAKDRATDVLRAYVDNSRMLLPDDPDVINDFNAATQQTAQEPVDAYGKRRMIYGTGKFHILDAARMFALGRSQQRIETIINTPNVQEPVYDLFLGQ